MRMQARHALHANLALLLLPTPTFLVLPDPTLAMRSQGQKRAVKTLAAGDVFGEVALLTKAPRQADCVAASR